MKKFILSGCILVLTFLSNFSVFAGSIPEDMLSDDKAQMFFAKLVSYSPNDDGETKANLIPTKIIKGDVKLGESLWYDKSTKCGDFTVKIGDEYLFLYYDEHNPTYFLKTSTQDTKTLKFQGTNGDMWKRLEQYLNEGKFEEAEIKRKQSINQLHPEKEETPKFPVFYTLSGFAVFVIVVILIIKKKSKH